MYFYINVSVCILTCFLYEEKYISIFMFIDLERERDESKNRHEVSLVVSDVFHKSGYTCM